MIHVDKFIPGGQTLGTMSDGRKIFFWNALPGEDVAKYDLTKKKSHYYEAIATEISASSPYRVQPQDDCFLSTSPWQILDWAEENIEKSALVEEIFREHHVDILVPPVITDGDSYHYRNKMEYALYWNNTTSQIDLAFHARGSHRKIPINKSSIERPEIFQKATEIISGLNFRHEEARKYQSLLLRCNQSGEVSGGLYENGRPHPSFLPLTDTILGYTYSYSPNGFFQINLPVYELALKEIKKHTTTDKVLDLYSGVGTIGLSVARDHHLTLVESNKSAHRESLNNIHGLQNVKSILTKSEDALGYITPDTTVILDPPRAGCDNKLINRLLEITPPSLIYLSCNPATQARDVAALLNKYRITKVQPFNFFPRTPHIENLTILNKK
ncbi:class I SAM-dependent RNA methyltransferase [Candidatus Saccharibacteria bacterium]|nr:class I SAM-dependent RNA methyltransferase [Candidatus Saccharibacteria bacterium]